MQFKTISIIRAYNQHWLVQEAEQRRISEMQQNSPVHSNIKQVSPQNQAPPIVGSVDVYSNQSGNMQQHNMTNSPVYENSSYVSQQQQYRPPQQSKMIPSASNNLPASHHHPNMVPIPMHNENVYANLGSQPSVPIQSMGPVTGYGR